MAAADQTQSWVLGILAAAVSGSGMGVGMVSGVLEVQRIAGPADLAGLTGVFYAIAYSGFLLPTVLAALAGHGGPPVPPAPRGHHRHGRGLRLGRPALVPTAPARALSAVRRQRPVVAARRGPPGRGRPAAASNGCSG
ncbi:hypothetical protein [Streptomyces olivaceus]|uniref:hypothetical protein n=1 Tax=Streptomyces olivaceus TaxID=47716 RepID=UPI0022EF1A64|nr:hypothetical protein [Streptomyces olivaceus]GHI93915.1 hypothetical protein TPA0905_33860 [Streptomyces olivaceus]